MYQSGISDVSISSHFFSKKISYVFMFSFKLVIYFLTILLNLFPLITPLVPAGIIVSPV